MAPGFPSFLLMHLQPVHIQRVKGWEEWDFWRHCGNSGVNLCVMLVWAARCHHWFMNPPHVSRRLWTTWLGCWELLGFSLSPTAFVLSVPTPLPPHKSPQVNQPETASEARGWGWKFSSTNNPIVFPPLTISEDFLLCPSSASCEALAGRTKGSFICWSQAEVGVRIRN